MTSDGLRPIMKEKRMKLAHSVVLGICLLTGFFFAACRTTGTTSLINGFTSYQNLQQVREKLQTGGYGRSWQESRNTIEPTDKRSPHDMVVLSGPFRHLGQDGTLRLTLFNDRLMTAEFSPVNSTAYLTALRQQLKDVPPNPKEQVVISRHTNFIYYAEPDGAMRFIWEDSKLSEEWKAWVKANS